MKAAEIRKLDDAKLEETLKDLKEELFNLRFQSATGQLDTPMRIREVKKNIARVKTIVTERKLGIRKEA